MTTDGWLAPVDYQLEGVISPKGKAVTVAHREGTTDLSTIGATFNLWGRTADEYGLVNHEPMTGWAIDVGAHVGSVAIALAVDNPDLQVLAVEALAQNCDVLRASLRVNDITNVTVVEAAASDVKRKHVAIAYGWTEADQLPKDYVEHMRFIGGMIDDPSGTVAYPPGASLDSLMTEYGIKRVRFMKIDCEGCEWKFLTSKRIRDVDEIVGEWHFAGREEGIHALLDATHEVVMTGGNESVGTFRAVAR